MWVEYSDEQVLEMFEGLESEDKWHLRKFGVLVLDVSEKYLEDEDSGYVSASELENDCCLSSTEIGLGLSAVEKLYGVNMREGRGEYEEVIWDVSVLEYVNTDALSSLLEPGSIS
ncbi:hypothetical protein LC1Nh_0019 [Candidatus Nanohalobium constans]|uniref:Uncharacterized protein n=2 Tax=Candidatus Nanohalobium constans TaxID=2565781 RepID=A0A5Q0UEH2_9ARCH|nr:hypothetical protein LC1Nh_0019 [Candidatus Nanohalobium constans]